MHIKLKNLLSRKFLITVAGVVCGIIAILTGENTDGVILIISSVLGYLIAEGYIDAQTVSSAVSTIADIANEVGKNLSNENVTEAAEKVEIFADSVGANVEERSKTEIEGPMKNQI